jgi:hypothetical protein
MNKTKMMSFYVEGPDWGHTVSIDPELFDNERAQIMEAASSGVEKQIDSVKKNKTSKKEALVNAYLCLVNIGKYKMAEDLRANFKKSSGQDLAEDKTGYSF